MIISFHFFTIWFLFLEIKHRKFHFRISEDRLLLSLKNKKMDKNIKLMYISVKDQVALNLKHDKVVYHMEMEVH